MTGDPRRGVWGTVRAGAGHLFAGATASGRGRLAVQALGIAVSAGLLGWCVWLALRPENQEKLRALRDIEPAMLAALLALSLVSLLFNGAGFWVTLRPVRRLGFWDVQAANAVASFLAYLPFKLSVLWRVVVHNRRDGVPVVVIGAWLAANALVVLAVLGPMAAAGLWRRGADWAYVAACIGGLLASYGVLLGVSRLFAGDRGRARLEHLADRTRVRAVSRLARWPAVHHLRAGCDMLAHPATLAGAMALRLGDVVTQAARFVVAARAVGEPLRPDQAVIIASAYYLVGVASPAGAVGGREGGATAVARLLPGVAASGFAVVALGVSAAEMGVYACTLAAAFVYLRPHRLLEKGPGHDRLQ